MAETKLNALLVNQVLVDSEGNFLTASVNLGVSESKLKEYVKGRPELFARWIEKPFPAPPTSLISRNDDPAIAEAIERENARLKEGIETLGLSDRAKSLGLACQRFQRYNYSSLQQMTNGGMAVAFLEALAELESLTRKLEEMDGVKEESKLAQESIWREAQAHIRDFIFKAATKVDQGILIQAKVHKLLNGDGNPDAAKQSKPGFAPLKKAVVSEQ